MHLKHALRLWLSAMFTCALLALMLVPSPNLVHTALPAPQPPLPCPPTPPSPNVPTPPVPCTPAPHHSNKQDKVSPTEICLRLVAEPDSATSPSSIVSYQIITRNNARRDVSGIQIILPYAPDSQTVLDAAFVDSNGWVSAVRPGEVEVRLGTLQTGASLTATLRLRTSATTQIGSTLTTRAHLNWDGQKRDEVVRSNYVTLVVSLSPASNRVVPLDIVPANGSSSTTFTFTYSNPK